VSDWIAPLIGASLGLMMCWAFVLMAEGAKGAREHCEAIGMFADKHGSEWVCIDRPEWKRVPK